MELPPSQLPWRGVQDPLPAVRGPTWKVCALRLGFQSRALTHCSLIPYSTENTPMIAGLGQVSQ